MQSTLRLHQSAIKTHPLAGVLPAAGPAPEVAGHDELLARMLGSWDLEKRYISVGDGSPEGRFPAEWHFGRAAGGRSIQDVLITRKPNGDLVGYGSTLRSYDEGRQRLVDDLAGSGRRPIQRPARADRRGMAGARLSDDGGEHWLTGLVMEGTRVGSATDGIDLEAPLPLPYLLADRPAAGLEADLATFGWLVGSWDVRVRSLGSEDEEPLTGEWHFGWVLEGRSIEDVLIVSGANGSPRAFNVSIRTFDHRAGRWWIVRQDALAGEFSISLAWPRDEGISTEGQWRLGDTIPFRSRFFGIAEDAFKFEKEIFVDGSWQRLQTIDAIRRVAA